MNNQSYLHDSKQYFARRHAIYVFLGLGFCFMMFALFIIPSSISGRFGDRLVIQLSGLLTGLSWLISFLWFFLPMLVVNKKYLVFYVFKDINNKNVILAKEWISSHTEAGNDFKFEVKNITIEQKMVLIKRLKELGIIATEI